jgi:hypothetical protein
MTPYTIALAGKAYFTKAFRSGKIQQLTVTKHSAFWQNGFTLFSVGSSPISRTVHYFKSLPFPHNISFQPNFKGKRADMKSPFPGIISNINITGSKIATYGLGGLRKLSSILNKDTAYLTASLDVIDTMSFSGKGNYKLIPVRSAR